MAHDPAIIPVAMRGNFLAMVSRSATASMMSGMATAATTAASEKSNA
jgi:hypothetical protein